MKRTQVFEKKPKGRKKDQARSLGAAAKGLKGSSLKTAAKDVEEASEWQVRRHKRHSEEAQEIMMDGERRE